MDCLVENIVYLKRKNWENLPWHTDLRVKVLPGVEYFHDAILQARIHVEWMITFTTCLINAISCYLNEKDLELFHHVCFHIYLLKCWLFWLLPLYIVWPLPFQIQHKTQKFCSADPCCFFSTFYLHFYYPYLC